MGVDKAPPDEMRKAIDELVVLAHAPYAPLDRGTLASRRSCQAALVNRGIAHQ
jgi:hypothetical protein